MKKRVQITIMVTLLTYISWGQSTKPATLFNGRCDDLTIQKSLDYISQLTGIQFAYTSSTISDSSKIFFEFQNVTLIELLDKFCKVTGLKYSLFGSQVLLKRGRQKPVRHFFSGVIIDKDSQMPIPYATVYIFNHQLGCISDIHGYFKLEVNENVFDDTVTFSSMGYESYSIRVEDFSMQKKDTLGLKSIVYEILPVPVSANDFKVETLGNDRKKPSGSLYMDTNGQQAALLVENEDNLDGKILTLNYYLSSSGNTDAPFRVRLYEVDSITGRPSNNLLNEFIVVKPDVEEGWYSVDIRKFNIMVPNLGFFIAMEGVFPNDYDFYMSSKDFIDLSDGDHLEATNNEPHSITYGQQLGYTRRKKDKNNTWHYSLSHTWFQLKKQPFGIMVSADIQVRKNKKNKKR